jgi:hypothetical protein
VSVSGKSQIIRVGEKEEEPKEKRKACGEIGVESDPCDGQKGSSHCDEEGAVVSERRAVIVGRQVWRAAWDTIYRGIQRILRNTVKLGKLN